MARFVWYVTKRILSYIVMIFVATSLTFFLASAFMNPRSNFEQRTPRPPQESIEENLYRTNLNDKTPVIERYQVWITNLLTKFDLGMTPTGDNVNREMSSRFMSSILLMTPATILSVIIGVSLGVYTAQRQYQWQDRFLSGVASVLLVIPTVVMAILIVFAAIEINARAGSRIFYVTDLSSGDTGNFFTWLIDFLQHIILPTIVLTIVSSVGYHLSQRTYLLDEMHADYVRTARAKGLTRKKAIRKHALRVSLIPTAVSVAFSLAGIFTGAVMTEKVFAIHGLGEYFINCINNNNIHGAVAVAAFSGAMTLVGALLADLFAAALDPRIKMS